MTDELVFYTNPMSRGRIVRWMLEEVGEPYRTEVIDYGAGMRSAEYLAVNPMGKVPAIRRGQTVVTEGAAICAYLADAFPDAGLAPPLAERGAYYRWLFFGAGPIEAAVAAKSMGWAASTPQEQGRLGFGSLERVMDTLEQALNGVAFIAADHFTAADLYLGAQLEWGMDFKLLESRPTFKSYVARVTDREAKRQATRLDDALLPKP